MKKLILIMAAFIMLTSCATTFGIEGSVTDPKGNVYAWKVVDDSSTKTAAVTVAYGGKKYSCEVNYKEAGDAPPTFKINVNATEITGSIMVEYRTVKTECKLDNVE